MQRPCYYKICKRTNIICCDSEMMLLPNLPKSKYMYHALWCRDDDITKSTKEPIPSIVMQRWWYYQIYQRANTTHCDAEIMLLPNLPKSQYHTLWCWDDAVTKSAKEQIPSIVIQRWCYYQICQRSMQTVHTISLLLMKLFVVYFTIPIKIACHCFNFIVKNSDRNKSVKFSLCTKEHRKSLHARTLKTRPLSAWTINKLCSLYNLTLCMLGNFQQMTFLLLWLLILSHHFCYNMYLVLR